MEKNKESELMEVVMETKAEAGASGYSVVGGGERGIFIKEVLKDSPAAKQLSLQKGDQLLSARVYFDNVKYEDALKILQCAEPYKVSFFLKRTVFQIDDSASQGASNVELKGPTAKIQRMVKPLSYTF
uniref:Periaxin n=1 Tax=Electrophorus electricus TaxID=8005 RepID=A0A4W4FSN0_ELEEL